jgi:hypothetical protein
VAFLAGFLSAIANHLRAPNEASHLTSGDGNGRTVARTELVSEPRRRHVLGKAVAGQPERSSISQA